MTRTTWTTPDKCRLSRTVEAGRTGHPSIRGCPAVRTPPEPQLWDDRASTIQRAVSLTDPLSEFRRRRPHGVAMTHRRPLAAISTLGQPEHYQRNEGRHGASVGQGEASSLV